MRVPGAEGERDLGSSDWDDQDLLTLQEASHRLREEIERLTQELAHLVDRGESGGRDAEVVGRRLEAMRAAHGRMTRVPQSCIQGSQSDKSAGWRPAR
jgi:hypothetical protein